MPDWRSRIRRRRWARLIGGAPGLASSGPRGIGAPVLVDWPEASHAVGYTVLTMAVEDHRGERTEVGLALWYPTASAPERYVYELGENSVESRLALDGQPEHGPFPLVLFSHGALGTGLNALFFAERLASRGYVVAAPDYPDAFFAARILGPQPRVRFLRGVEMVRWVKDLRDRQLDRGGKAFRRAHLGYRPRAAKAALDRVLGVNDDGASPFHETIDAGRIGLLGHSFGAWTSLLLAGADPELADPRVGPVVSLSAPCNDGVFEPDEIGRIRVPVMFVYGSEEWTVGRASDRVLYYDRAHPPKLLLEIEGGDHFTFSGGIRDEFPEVKDYLARDSRRATVVRYTEAFFDRYLRADAGALDSLRAGGAGVSTIASDLPS